MNRWNRWNQILQEGEPDPAGSGSDPNGNPSDPPTDPAEPSPTNLDPTPTGIESPFGEDSPFAGKSVQEVEAEMQVMSSAVKEQGQRLTEQHRQLSAQPAAPAPAEPEVPITSEKFYADPAGATAEIVETVVQKHLAKVIEPFAASMSVDQTRAAWVEAERQIPQVRQYRDLIQAKLDLNGITEPNVASLTMLCQVVIGELAMAGQYDTPTPADPTPTGGRPAPPQHPASNQPIAPQGQPVKLRDLTENEMLLAKMKGQTHEQFLTLLEMDEADVITSGRTE